MLADSTGVMQFADGNKEAVAPAYSLGVMPSSIHVSPSTDATNTLELASIMYAGARVGGDANREFCLAGLAQLCQAAIDFVQAHGNKGAAARDQTDVSTLDTSLQLDTGR